MLRRFIFCVIAACRHLHGCLSLVSAQHVDDALVGERQQTPRWRIKWEMELLTDISRKQHVKGKPHLALKVVTNISLSFPFPTSFVQYPHISYLFLYPSRVLQLHKNHLSFRTVSIKYLAGYFSISKLISQGRREMNGSMVSIAQKACAMRFKSDHS